MARKNFGPGWAAREVRASNKRKAAAAAKPEVAIKSPVQFVNHTEPVEHNEGIWCPQKCGQKITGSIVAHLTEKHS
jgi:hypothetical protein